MPLKVLFAASECSPFAKVGGLGDVIGSLPQALANDGIDARIVLPKYGAVGWQKYQLEPAASGISVGKEKVNVYKTELSGSRIIVYLLENDRFFAENHIYFERTAFVGSFKEIERFLFFSQAVLEIFAALKWIPDILHCHDWHTAILPVLAKLQQKTKSYRPKTLLTVHNLENQGKWDAKSILDFLNLKGTETESLAKIDKEGNLNILEQGILNADILNTVSPTYKKEILTKEYGAGLQESLLKRKKDLFGVLNGINTAEFNPAADADIACNYSSGNLEGKKEAKYDLQRILKFKQSQEIPLLGIINRLTDQKGIDLVLDLIPEFAKAGLQLVVLGVGAANYEKKLIEAGLRYPENISVQIKFDAVLAKKIYAGCDMFLMPSRFEPCGLGQMIAMRYGTIPVVRKTGGLADTVLHQKTGFVFEKYASKDFLSAINAALKRHKDKNYWTKMIKNAMETDFSWQKAAKEYLKLYQN